MRLRYFKFGVHSIFHCEPILAKDARYYLDYGVIDLLL